MPTNNQRGIGAYYEQQAADYLCAAGLTLVEKNFLCRNGEIDLIMQDRQIVVFVEVKYRTKSTFGHAAEMVTPAKIKKLIKAAQYWMMRNHLSPYTTEFRFDVIAIDNNGNDINWFKNAITQD